MNTIGASVVSAAALRTAACVSSGGATLPSIQSDRRRKAASRATGRVSFDGALISPPTSSTHSDCHWSCVETLAGRAAWGAARR